MQMCGNCMKVYDESEYSKCPFCSDDKDEYMNVIFFDEDTGVEKSVTKSERFPGIEWFCDHCNACLSYQHGFDDHCYVWKCTECGYKNSISLDNIIY